MPQQTPRDPGVSRGTQLVGAEPERPLRETTVVQGLPHRSHRTRTQERRGVETMPGSKAPLEVCRAQ